MTGIFEKLCLTFPILFAYTATAICAKEPFDFEHCIQLKSKLDFSNDLWLYADYYYQSTQGSIEENKKTPHDQLWEVSQIISGSEDKEDQIYAFCQMAENGEKIEENLSTLAHFSKNYQTDLLTFFKADQKSSLNPEQIALLEKAIQSLQISFKAENISRNFGGSIELSAADLRKSNTAVYFAIAHEIGHSLDFALRSETALETIKNKISEAKDIEDWADCFAARFTMMKIKSQEKLINALKELFATDIKTHSHRDKDDRITFIKSKTSMMS